MSSVTNLEGGKKKKYPQLSFRVTEEEKARYDELVALVRQRARYKISEAAILKTLMGFRDLEPHLSDSDKKLLKPKQHPEHKHHAGRKKSEG